MEKPYRPVLPPKAGYVERGGEYVRIKSDGDIQAEEKIAELEEKILLLENQNETAGTEMM